MPAEPPAPSAGNRPEFPATRWTLVGRLRGGSEEEASRALNELCRHYWYPVFALLRHGGHAPHDAEDLTQGFFAALVADRTLLHADPGRGRLRNFLHGALKRFLTDEYRHRTAKKRGGGAAILSFERDDAEHRYQTGPVDERDPEKLYLAAWARSLVDRVRQKMSAGFAGGAEVYGSLAPFIEGDMTEMPYRELAAKLGQTESGARVLVHRLRQRFRELLTEAVRQTVESPGEVEDELAWVLTVLREGAGV